MCGYCNYLSSLELQRSSKPWAWAYWNMLRGWREHFSCGPSTWHSSSKVKKKYIYICLQCWLTPHGYIWAVQLVLVGKSLYKSAIRSSQCLQKHFHFHDFSSYIHGKSRTRSCLHKRAKLREFHVCFSLFARMRFAALTCNLTCATPSAPPVYSDKCDLSFISVHDTYMEVIGN